MPGVDAEVGGQPGEPGAVALPDRAELPAAAAAVQLCARRTRSRARPHREIGDRLARGEVGQHHLQVRDLAERAAVGRGGEHDPVDVAAAPGRGRRRSSRTACGGGVLPAMPHRAGVVLRLVVEDEIGVGARPRRPSSQQQRRDIDVGDARARRSSSSGGPHGSGAERGCCCPCSSAVMTGSCQTTAWHRRLKAWHHARCGTSTFSVPPTGSGCSCARPEPFAPMRRARGCPRRGARRDPVLPGDPARSWPTTSPGGPRTGVAAAWSSASRTPSPTTTWPTAERNVVAQLRTPRPRSAEPRRSIFVRVRSARADPDARRAARRATRACWPGSSLPKFTEDNGAEYLDAVVAGERGGRPAAAGDAGARVAGDRLRRDAGGSLTGIRRLLDKYRDLVLAVRIGATDLSGAYGLRRVAGAHGLRRAGGRRRDRRRRQRLRRADAGGYVVTGPVWEYFSATERMFKPQLRESPFVAARGARAAGRADRAPTWTG